MPHTNTLLTFDAFEYFHIIVFLYLKKKILPSNIQTAIGL